MPALNKSKFSSATRYQAVFRYHLTEIAPETIGFRNLALH
jgi:hypothetical protein